jgi:hypothetical protein
MSKKKTKSIDKNKIEKIHLDDYAKERIKKEKKDKLDKLHNQKLIKK